MIYPNFFFFPMAKLYDDLLNLKDKLHVMWSVKFITVHVWLFPSRCLHHRVRTPEEYRCLITWYMKGSKLTRTNNEDIAMMMKFPINIRSECLLLSSRQRNDIWSLKISLDVWAIPCWFSHFCRNHRELFVLEIGGLMVTFVFFFIFLQIISLAGCIS